MPQMVTNIFCNKTGNRGCSRVKGAGKRHRCKSKNRPSRKCKYSCKQINVFNQINYSRKCPVRRSVSIRPMVKRYFFVAPEDIDLADGKVIFSSEFVNDRGEPVSKFSNYGREGYINLSINGVLQEGGMYRVISDALLLVPIKQVISAGTPITIESVGFAAKLTYK